MSNIENNYPLDHRAYDIRRVLSEMELPSQPIVLSDSEAELARGMPTAFAAYKSADSESTKQARGRGSAFGQIALNLGKMGVLQEITPDSDLTLEHMSSCVDELDQTYEGVVAELSLNFPMHEEFMMDSLSDGFKKGVVSALFMTHSWAVAKCGEAYSGIDILPQQGVSPFPKQESADTDESESPSSYENHIPSEGNPYEDQIAMLIEISMVDGAMFKFGADETGPVLKVFMPIGTPLNKLVEIEKITGPARLNLENDVICLVSNL